MNEYGQAIGMGGPLGMAALDHIASVGNMVRKLKNTHVRFKCA